MINLQTEVNTISSSPFGEVEPSVLVGDIFFDKYDTAERMMDNSHLKELINYIITQEVDYKGWSGSYLGIQLSVGMTAYGRNLINDFLCKSVSDKIKVYNEMRARQAAGFQAKGLTVTDFAYEYKIPLVSAMYHYNNAFSSFSTYEGAYIRRIPYQGWRFPIESARHCLIAGASRMGKSVTLAKVIAMELEHGTTVIDLHDSGGRLESAAMSFSIFDEKFSSLVDSNWGSIGIDGFDTSRRIVGDIKKVRSKIVDFYSEGSSFNVVYYHPLVETLPERIPVTDKLTFKFFTFGVGSLIRSLGDNVFSTIFSSLGEKLTDIEETFLSYAVANLKSKGSIEKVSLRDITDLLDVWHGSEGGVDVEIGDITRRIDFSGRKVMNLIRKIDMLHASGLFQPDFIISEESGELIRNPLVLDVSDICSRKGTLICFSTKWSNPDLRYIIIAYFIRELMEGKRFSKIKERVCLLSRELNELASFAPSGLEALTCDAIVDVVSRGSDLGVRFVGDCQQISQINRKIKRLIHVYLFHRIIDSREKDDIVRSLSRYALPLDFKDDVSMLDVGECIAVYMNSFSKVSVVPANCMNKVEGLDILRLVEEYSNSYVDVPSISELWGSHQSSTTLTTEIVKDVPEMLRLLGFKSPKLSALSVIFSGVAALRMKHLTGEKEVLSGDEIREALEKYFGGQYLDDLNGTRSTWMRVLEYSSENRTYSINHEFIEKSIGKDFYTSLSLIFSDLSSFFGIGSDWV